MTDRVIRTLNKNECISIPHSIRNEVGIDIGENVSLHVRTGLFGEKEIVVRKAPSLEEYIRYVASIDEVIACICEQSIALIIEDTIYGMSCKSRSDVVNNPCKVSGKIQEVIHGFSGNIEMFSPEARHPIYSNFGKVYALYQIPSCNKNRMFIAIVGDAFGCTKLSENDLKKRLTDVRDMMPKFFG